MRAMLTNFRAWQGQGQSQRATNRVCLSAADLLTTGHRSTAARGMFERDGERRAFDRHL